MASYHLSVKILSRSSGRSGVAAAAYRSRGEIHDVRQGMTFDYSKKQDLAHAEILAPENAPAWMLDRAQLWNGVEAFEKRRDAQIMREVEVALPVELSKQNQIDLLHEFCRHNFVSQGMVADICMHQDPGNPHAHIMLTMREIQGEGFGKKVRSWNKKENLLKWREEWANVQNVYLAREGFDKQVDHRSYADQGLAIEPQVKKGVPGYAKEKTEYERAREFKRIAFNNGRRIIEDPQVALDHLSRNQSTFTHDDILKYVHAHSDESQFHAAVAAVTNSPDLIKIEENAYDRFSRYTTRSLMTTEKRMLETAGRLGEATTHRVRDKYIRQAGTANALSPEQGAALEQILKGGDLHAVVGHAGTGKSYTLKAVREAFESAGYTVQGAALAGVAAEGLEISSGIRSTTIHRKLFDWDNGRSRIDKRSILVIDEAGMVGTRQMRRILSEAEAAGAKVIVAGDTKQTQAVEAGGAFRGIIERVETSRLSEVWRQRDEWQKEATRLFSGTAADIHQALEMYNTHGQVGAFETYGQAASAMLNDYVRQYDPQTTSVMTAHKNEDIERLNLVCRDGLKKHTGHLAGEEVKIRTSTGTKAFAVGERVLFLRNEKSLGVKNGTFGTVEAFDQDGRLSVSLAGGRRVAVDTRFYNNLTYGYAATVHKLQGATVGRTYFLASEGVDRHIGYVAMSRHRDEVRLYYSADKFQNFEHLKRTLSNLGEKELLEDYGAAEDLAAAELRRLTATDATFTEKQLEQAAGRLDDAAQQVFYDGIDEVGQARRGEQRFSTTEMVALEKEMFRSAEVLGQSHRHALGNDHLTTVLSGHELDDNQRFVVTRAAASSDLVLIDYQFDTDRARVAGVVAEAYRKKGYVVEGLALSGMGAANFKQDAGIESVTVHKRLWEWSKGRNLPNGKSVLIVDNASMIGTRQTREILDRSGKADAKVVMFGEEQFLQPIDAGGAYRGLGEKTGITRATLLRKDEPFTWRHEALDLIKGDRDDAARALDLYAEHGCIHKSGSDATAREQLVDDWLSDVRSSRTYRGRVMLAYTNQDAGDLNKTARARLKDLGYVDREDTRIETAEKGALDFAPGDRIMFLRKEDELGVQSGSIGTLRGIDGDKLSVRMDAGPTITIDTRLYNDLNHGYATTVYRSAGIEAENAYILAGRHFNKHATMSALQCHRKEGKIYHSFRSHQELKDHLCRPVDKDLATDYLLEGKVYRISVKVASSGRTYDRTLVLEPQVTKKNTLKQLDKAAKEFAYKVCVRERIESPEKELTVSVDQLHREQAREHLKQMDAAKKKGRGREIEM